MNNGEVIDLLSLITAYDGRNAGPAELHAWAEAAQRGRWTYAEAADAVSAHFAESTEWLMPGHITQRLRQRRAEPPRSNALPAATPRPADEAHVCRVVDWLAARLAADRETAADDQWRALGIECPHCRAEPGARCVQTVGMHGQRRDPVRPIEVPHIQRRRAARPEE